MSGLGGAVGACCGVCRGLGWVGEGERVNRGGVV